MDNNTLQDASELIPNLTAAEREEITEELLLDPIETVAIASSPEDEACENLTTYYFGVSNISERWCVFCCQEGDAAPEFGGSFDGRKEALERASEWAYETEQAAEDVLNEMKDVEWARGAETPSNLEPPFRFSDTTDFVRAVELEDEDEVFDFFKRHGFLFSPEEWGNLYCPTLVDANGRACWVVRTHRAEIRLIEA